MRIPDFYANKRLIGLATIIQELANNYTNGNPIWSYYSRDHQMIYSNSKELRPADMEDINIQTTNVQGAMEKIILFQKYI